jgi:nucleotide-binding universal stress UspA family protein
MTEFRKILFPVSLTKLSPIVAPYVASMAAKYGAEVHLLHITRELDGYVDAYIEESSEYDIKRVASDFEKEIHTGAEARLNRFKQQHFEGLGEVRAQVRSGRHYKEILEYVASEQVDLIIMGTGRGVIAAMFGSVADKVAKLAPVPVMLIKKDA